MKAAIQELTLNLARQLELYRQVLNLIEDERQALSGQRPALIMNLVRLKEAQLVQIRSLEEARHIMCLRLAKRWKVPVASLTMTQIGETLSRHKNMHETGAKLCEVASLLASALERLNKANMGVNELCKTGLETVQGMALGINRQRNTNSTPAGYGNRSRSQAAAPVSSLHVKT